MKNNNLWLLKHPGAIACAIWLSSFTTSTVQAREVFDVLGGELTTKGFLSSEFRGNTERGYATQWVQRFQLEADLKFEEAGFFEELSFVTIVRPEYDVAYYYGDDITSGHVGRGADRPSHLGVDFSYANDPIGFAGFDVLFGSPAPGLLSTGGLTKNVTQGVWAPSALQGFEAIAIDTAFPLLVPRANQRQNCKNCRDVNDSARDIALGNTGTSGSLYPIRELYVDAVVDDWWIRLGKQQIVWGKTDFFRLQDLVNPIDFGKHFFFDNFEDIRVPQWALSTQYKFGTLGKLEDTALQVVWNFDEFRRVGLGNPSEAWAHPFGKEIGTFAAFNTYFSPEPCVSRATQVTTGAPASVVCQAGDGRLPSGFGIPLGLTEDELPSHKVSNTELGGRFEFRLDKVRFALSHYYGWGDSPVFKFNTVNVNAAVVPGVTANDNLVLGLVDGGLLGLPAGSAILNPVAVMEPNAAIAAAAAGGDADAIAALAQDNASLFYRTGKTFGGQISMDYDKVHTSGLSFDYYDDATELVFRVESSYTFNEPVNNTRKANWVDESDVFRFSLGVDKQMIIPFINKNRTVFLSAQFFDTYYIDHEGNGDDGMFVNEHNWTYTLFAQTHYLRDQLIPEAFLVFEDATDSWVFGARFEYLFNNNFSMAAGYYSIWGGDDNTFDVGPFTSFTLDGNYSQQAVFGFAREGISALKSNDEAFLRFKYQF